MSIFLNKADSRVEFDARLNDNPYASNLGDTRKQSYNTIEGLSRHVRSQSSI